MKQNTLFRFLAFAVVPFLAYLGTHSWDAVYKSSLLLGVPIILYLGWYRFSHKALPIYMLGDANIKKDILDDIVCESRTELENGDIVYDLMFCQLIDPSQDDTHFKSEDSYFFYHDVKPPTYFKGTVIVDNVMKFRHELPDSRLCTMKDFWSQLKDIGHFE